jgi:hypothetical protein
MHLQFNCPNTKLPISFEFTADVGTLAHNWHKDISIFCPHCRNRHPFDFRAAYVWTMLHDHEQQAIGPLDTPAARLAFHEKQRQNDNGPVKKRLRRRSAITP